MTYFLRIHNDKRVFIQYLIEENTEACVAAALLDFLENRWPREFRPPMNVREYQLDCKNEFAWIFTIWEASLRGSSPNFNFEVTISPFIQKKDLNKYLTSSKKLIREFAKKHIS